MKVFIKEAISSDIKEIHNMLTDLIQDERQYDDNVNKNYVVKDYYEQFLDKRDSCIIVAKNESDIIMGYGFGFIINYGNVYTNKIAQLDALFIKPEYRKRGIATKIIKYFTEWSKKRQVSFIELTVCNNNNEAKMLYEKEGFYTEKTILKKKI